MRLRISTSAGESYDVKEDYDSLNHTLGQVLPGQLIEFTLTDNRKVAVAAFHIVSIEVKDGQTERK